MQPQSLSESILALASRQRLIRASDVQALGGTPQLLVKLHKTGRLERVARGLYSLPDAQPSEHASLAEVSKRVPRGVVCLLSALQLHDVGSQLPHEVWLALPMGSATPKLDYPPLKIIRLSGDACTSGIETFEVDGVPVRVYSLAKTVADCFKFRHRIGLDVALEALRGAWLSKRLRMDELDRYARIDRISTFIRPYIEAIAA